MREPVVIQGVCPTTVRSAGTRAARLAELRRTQAAKVAKLQRDVGSLHRRGAEYRGAELMRLISECAGPLLMADYRFRAAPDDEIRAAAENPNRPTKLRHLAGFLVRMAKSRLGPGVPMRGRSS